MSSGPPKAVVYRRFEGQEKVCEQALRILLQKKGGPIAAPDARKEFNEPDEVRYTIHKRTHPNGRSRKNRDAAKLT